MFFPCVKCFSMLIYGLADNHRGCVTQPIYSLCVSLPFLFVWVSCYYFSRIRKWGFSDRLSHRGVFIAPQYCGVGTGQHMYINAFEGLDVSKCVDHFLLFICRCTLSFTFHFHMYINAFEGLDVSNLGNVSTTFQFSSIHLFTFHLKNLSTCFHF